MSDSFVPGSQQCPDAGSVGAGESDVKTEVVEIKANKSEGIRLLGPNRRVVIAQGATMTGPVTICGDGATVLVIGVMKGAVLLQGSGVKIVLQEAAKPPPAYNTTNGRVFKCTTNNADPNTPHCADFTPRPGAKPNG